MAGPGTPGPFRAVAAAPLPLRLLFSGAALTALDLRLQPHRQPVQDARLETQL